MESDKESFSSKMEDLLESGYLLVGFSLGVKLGLFEALAQTTNSVTVDQLAEMTKCKPRYIKEWLCHMVVGDIVEVDETGKRFYLPEHRQEMLTTKNKVTNFGCAFPYFMSVHETLLSCFKVDGPNGMPFSDVVTPFKEISRRKPKMQSLFAEVLIEKLPDLKEKLEKGMRVLDVGCGHGGLLIYLASQYPESHFVGIDFSTEMLEDAKVSVQEKTLQNIEFQLQDACDLPELWLETFDLVLICSVVHDVAYVKKTLDGINKCMKQGGYLCVSEFNMSSDLRKTIENPIQKKLGRIAYTVSMYHCLPASMYFPDSDALGTCPGTEVLTQYLNGSGFEVLEVDTVAMGPISAIILCQKK